jgi:hypothetical protein
MFWCSLAIVALTIIASEHRATLRYSLCASLFRVGQLVRSAWPAVAAPLATTSLSVVDAISDGLVLGLRADDEAAAEHLPLPVPETFTGVVCSWAKEQLNGWHGRGCHPFNMTLKRWCIFAQICECPVVWRNGEQFRWCFGFPRRGAAPAPSCTFILRGGTCTQAAANSPLTWPCTLFIRGCFSAGLHILHLLPGIARWTL